MWSEVSHTVYCLYQALSCLIVRVVSVFLPYSWRAKSVAGHVVLITGAGSGIGQLLACEMARLGAVIVVWDINEEGARKTVRLVQKSGGSAIYFICDIRDREAVYRTAKQVKSKVGKVDILVNNAGVVVGKNLMELSDEAIEDVFRVNAISHFWTTKAFLPDMLETRSGHIVSVSSLAGLQGLAQLTDYCSSKFASAGFYEALSVELKALGHDTINTTLVCPFFINTGMFEGAQSKIIPFLDPSYVADRIVKAIRLNEDQVIIPGWLHFLFYLKLTLPHMFMVWLTRLLGVERSMVNFCGRNRDPQQNRDPHQIGDQGNLS